MPVYKYCLVTYDSNCSSQYVSVFTISPIQMTGQTLENFLTSSAHSSFIGPFRAAVKSSGFSQ